MAARRRPLAFLLLLPVLVGPASCGGSTPEPHTAAPRDPTPLAKCKIAASQSSPLVTEWPASEKAHLEGMLEDSAVAVAYSGCELRILESCHPRGSYVFHRTNLSTDTLAIDSEDDLYSKLPLGAVSLAGELAKSGRLAIRTTVVGQKQLLGGTAELPEGSACAQATHIVTALSVGAFKLLSGGAVSGKAGVEAGSVGGGVKSSRSEEVLRESGDPGQCSRSMGKVEGPKGTSKKGDKDKDKAPPTMVDQANPDCSSPIQIFLEPIDRTQTAARRPAEPDSDSSSPPEPAPPRAPGPHRGRGKAGDDGSTESPGAVKVNFALPAEGGRWTLVGSDGAPLCELPCSRWVGKSSGMIVQLDADKAEDIKKIKVPADLGYSAGRTVDAVPQIARSSTLMSVAFYGGLLGAVVGAAMLGNTSTGCSGKNASVNGAEPTPNTPLCTPGIAVAVGSGAIGLGGLIGFAVYSRAEKLDMHLSSSSTARTDGIGPSLRFGPTGVTGAF